MHIKNLFKGKYSFIVLAIICTALWGTAFPGVKLGYKWFDIPNNDTGSKLMFAGIRFMTAGIIVLFIFFIKNKKIPLFSKDQALPIFSLAAVQITGNYFFYYLGLSVTAGSVASVLNSFDTFCSVMMVSLFFKEDKLTFKKISGCAIGLTGIILVNLSEADFSSFSLTGEGFIIASALFSSFGIIINKKAAMKADVLIVTGYHLLFGGIILTLTAATLGRQISFSNPKADACLIYLSLVSAIAFLIWTELLKYNPVSKVSVFKLMTPIFGNVFSAIALNENILSPIHLLSVALVAAGIGIVNSKNKTHKKNFARHEN